MGKTFLKLKRKLKKALTKKWLIASLSFLLFFTSILPVLASDKNINTATTFTALDGSAQDDDGTVNGIFTVDGNLNLTGSGAITCDDPASPANNSACPIKISVSQNLTMDAGTVISAENNVSGGSGADIQITVGGNILLKGPSGSEDGAKISSARTTTGGSGNGGNLSIFANGTVNFEAETIVSAANLGGGKAGDIYLSSQGQMNLDGLISAGPSNTVLASKLTGFVLANGNTTQRGGKISIACSSGQVPGVTVGTNGVIVSQGEDPASDSIVISGCGINVYGLVASVAKKSNGSPGNSPVVSLLSGAHVLVNGSDLGGVGLNQGKIRADYVIGENHIPNFVNIFATNDITVFGPGAGAIFTVSANGGSATNQKGGTISLISTEGKVISSGLAIQADGGPGSGSMGGAINIESKDDTNLSGATLFARGATTGGNPDGGDVTVRSYSGNIVANAGSLINVTGGAPTPEGTVNLTACGTIAFPPGVTIPVSSTNTTGTCSPAAPTLPQGFVLPVCTRITPTPTETLTPTPTDTVTPTPTDTVTPTPTDTVTPTPTDSVTPTPTDTVTPTPTDTVTPTPTDVLTPTPTTIDCPDGQIFDTGIQICIDCPGGGDCEVIIGSPTPTPTTGQQSSPTPTPTNPPSNSGGPGDGLSDGRSDGKSTSAPSQAVLGASTLAGTGAFNNLLSDIFLLAGIITMGTGFLYGKKKIKNTK